MESKVISTNQMDRSKLHLIMFLREVQFSPSSTKYSFYFSIYIYEILVPSSQNAVYSKYGHVLLSRNLQRIKSIGEYYKKVNNCELAG